MNHTFFRSIGKFILILAMGAPLATLASDLLYPRMCLDNYSSDSYFLDLLHSDGSPSGYMTGVTAPYSGGTGDRCVEIGGFFPQKAFSYSGILEVVNQNKQSIKPCILAFTMTQSQDPKVSPFQNPFLPLTQGYCRFSYYYNPDPDQINGGTIEVVISDQ